jgi:hypothetical protein
VKLARTGEAMPSPVDLQLVLNGPDSGPPAANARNPMFTPCERQDNRRAMNSYNSRATVGVGRA